MLKDVSFVILLSARSLRFFLEHQALVLLGEVLTFQPLLNVMLCRLFSHLVLLALLAPNQSKGEKPQHIRLLPGCCPELLHVIEVTCRDSFLFSAP